MYTHECANTYVPPMFVNYMGLRERSCTENWGGCLSEQAHLDEAVSTCICILNRNMKIVTYSSRKKHSTLHGHAKVMSTSFNVIVCLYVLHKNVTISITGTSPY